MSRRRFLSTLAGAGIAAACAGAPRPRTRRAPIAAVAFDLYTVFDPRGIDHAVRALVPAASEGFGQAWRTRAFEHAWIRAAAGQYADFRTVLADALVPVAAAEALAIDDTTAEALLETFETLSPWPDAREVLAALGARGIRRATLANYAPTMIRRLLAQADLADAFDLVLSTDDARTYKPDPRAYALGERALDLPREAIAFSAFGSWDAAGATWFGYPTFWVNRLGVTADPLATPEATGPSLRELVAWLDARG